MNINTSKLTSELIAAGININGVRSTGVVFDNKDNEIQDRQDVQAIIQVHDPTPDSSVTLLEEYNKAGITTQKMIFALWKKVMNADSADADALQVLIDQVNSAISK